MAKVAPTAARSIAAVRNVRRAAYRRLAKYPNVIGSMIGRKMVGGQITKALGLTVFVSRKLARADLRGQDRIPGEIRVGGATVVVDVVETAPFQNQADVFPRPGALRTYDGRNTGTLSCLCRSANGAFGMTCAHVLEGADSDPTTLTPVSVWSSSLAGYQSVGRSVFAISGPGAGMPGEYGFSDAGIFAIEHSELMARAGAAMAVAAAKGKAGEVVVGIGAAKGARRGRILGIEQELLGVLADFVIKVDPPGTFGGDSGMLWRNERGQPVAIHAKGSGQGAFLTAAMSAARAEEGLGVELLNDPV